MDPALIYDNMLASLRGEFVDEAEDQLNVIDVVLGNIESGEEDRKTAIIKIQRPAHSLKGSSSVADFPLVTIIIHRLEDYLSVLKEIKDENIRDIEKFVELAREYSKLEIDQKSISTSELVRKLPAKIIEGVDITPPLMSEPKEGEDSNLCEVPIIEVMMVIKERTAGLLFERELRAAGLRVTTIRNSLEAINMAIHTKPDLFIASAVIDGTLSGIDIVCALRAMPSTKNINVCLLTSFERGHHDLEDFPEDIDLIHKNKLKDDLLEILDKNEMLG